MSRKSKFNRRSNGFHIEPFERRLLFSTYLVNYAGEDGKGAPGSLSLYQAVALANAHAGADTIKFDLSIGQQDVMGANYLRFTDTTGTTTLAGPILLTPAPNTPSQRIVISSGAAVIMNDVTIAGVVQGGADSTGNTLGGAIVNAGNLTMNRCQMDHNIVVGTSYVSYLDSAHAIPGVAMGGAIYSTGSLTISDSIFFQNKAMNSAPFNADSSQTSGGACGGAIYSVGQLSLVNDTFFDNSAIGYNQRQFVPDGFNGEPAYGGAIFSTGTTSVTSSTIGNNSAINYHSFFDQPVANQNAAVRGGGLYVTGQLSLSQSTIADNTLVRPGTAAVANDVDATSAAVTAGNSIVSALVGTIASGSHNLINTDAQLRVITDHPDETARFYELLPNADSSALNAGDNKLVPANTPTDVRGMPRVSDSTVDIGSTEVQISVVRLYGNVFGTAGSFRKFGNTVIKAFDDSDQTFFDGPTADGNFAAVDLGISKVLTSISYSPRPGWANRMIGGIFQASNSADFSHAVNLYTIKAAPAGPTQFALTGTGSYRYVRYLSPAGSYGNIAEMRVFGKAVESQNYIGGVFGTEGAYQNSSNDVYHAVDGDLSTYFDGPTPDGNWVGYQLAEPVAVTEVTIAPRVGWEQRMIGGEIQASYSADFTIDVTTLFTISSKPNDGLTTYSFANTTAFPYYRYLGPKGSYGNIAELQFAA